MEKARQWWGERREYIVTHQVRCRRLSYSSESRSIFSFSRLSGTPPLLEGSGGRAQQHCQPQGSLCTPHAVPTYPQHRRQMFPGLRFASYRVPGSSSTHWELAWFAERSFPLFCSTKQAPMQYALPHWARSFTPLQHPVGEEGLVHHPTACCLSAEVSPAPLAFSGNGWELLTWIKKKPYFFISSWSCCQLDPLLEAAPVHGAHGSTKADMENAWPSWGQAGPPFWQLPPTFCSLKQLWYKQPHSLQRP